MTVSRVVNDQPGVAPKTRAKIEAAISELDYAPSRVASSLSSSRTNLIGMIVPDVSNPFFGTMVHAAEVTARKAGYRLLLCNSEGDLRLERTYVADLVEHRVEGLILAPCGDEPSSHLKSLANRGYPLVLIDREIEGVACDSVMLDNVDAARQLVDHLLSFGHRRVAILTDASGVSTGRQRLLGARQAFDAAGLPFDEGLVFRTSTDLLGGYRATQQFVGLEERPTAIFAVNNMTAVGAIKALGQAHLSVPDDISIVCFDDVPHLAVIAPVLTVIDQPEEEMATAAAELLLEQIARQAKAAPRRVIFPGTLVVRRSASKARGA